MHRIRQWMSSVALVATAGLVLVAARQFLSNDEPARDSAARFVSEPPRLATLPRTSLEKPLAGAPEGHASSLTVAAHPAQHTYPIREPSAGSRQTWRGELPLGEMLPSERDVERGLQPPVREPQHRSATVTRSLRAPPPVFEEEYEESADEAETEPPPPPKKSKKRRPIREPQPPAEEEFGPSAPAPRTRQPIRAYEEEEIVLQKPHPTLSSRQVGRQPVAPRHTLPAEEPIEPTPQALLPTRTPPVPRVARGQLDLNSPSMRAVLEKAREHTQHGFSLGQRGAIFSARSEFIQALRLVAQALDTQLGGDAYGQSLAAGMQAIEEADDFAPKGSKLEAHLNLSAVVKAHSTPTLKNVPAEELSPLVALQAYYAYARERLAFATGQTLAGSEALYALGKLQTEAARLEPSAERMHQAKGMAFHQAALDADSRNYQASNELGVLLARHGQWEAAKRLLVHSVQLQPQPEVWRNLATVHATLGETELARLAENERALLQPNPADHPLAGQVQWIDPVAFAATGPQGVPTPRVATQSRASTPAAQPATSGSNWFTPWTSFIR